GAADIEAVRALPAEQRSAMIASMVSRLAARLQTEPNDVDGWQRLARSYGVLGEKEKAVAAAERAAALRPDMGTLREAAQMVFAAEGSDDPRQPLPSAFVSLMKRILALDPNEPDALWYLGLAQAQEKNLHEATEYWHRLVAALPEDSERRRTVSAALSALD